MISVLDCTLRDGGRIIDCAFADDKIREIVYKLAEAKIDIIEVGFLRDGTTVNYKGNSTFFTDVEQIIPFLNKDSNSMYVAFADFGMFDFDTLKPCDGKSIDGIRVGFTKKDFMNSRDKVIHDLKKVKTCGYKLFVQGVNTLAYSDKEILELVDMINEINPYSFGIVDTYGAMYADDLDKIFQLIHNNMYKDICIDFHSHNNYQLSFSLAQEIIRLVNGNRHLIIDATLNGMGKVAGNLNLELLIDYLVRKLHLDYEFNLVLDMIDDYIEPYKQSYEWGYSVPAMMAGVYQSHPNNILYLTSKFRIQNRDIKNLISMIDPLKRQRYDYDNIERLYLEYNNVKVDDSAVVETLREEFAEKEILVIAPGESVLQNKHRIREYQMQESVVSISVNFVFDQPNYVFFGNKKRYMSTRIQRQEMKCILSSNITPDSEQDILVNYYDLINTQYKYFENSTMMLLYMLRRIGVRKISIAGFDGFNPEKDNYIDDTFQNSRHMSEFSAINREISEMLEDFAISVKGKTEINLITPSVYRKSIPA